MGVSERNLDDAEPTKPQAAQDQELDRLSSEVVLLKGVVADLTAAHENMLNTYRRMSEGGIPNN